LYFTSYFRLFKYMVSFPRYFTVCITYQPPLVHGSVYFLESDIPWMEDQMLRPKHLAIQVTTTLPHGTYFRVDSWRTSYTAIQLNIWGSRQHITNAVAQGRNLER